MSAPSHRGRSSTERDDPGAVTVVAARSAPPAPPRRRPLGGHGRRAGRLRIAVDQHHHIGGTVGQPLGHMQPAAAGADRPVDGAQLVAGHVGADVGVLDPAARYAGSGGCPADRAIPSAECAVGCGGVSGNTMTSAASTVAVPASNPPRATSSTRARMGYRPHRSAATATVCRWSGCPRPDLESHPLDGRHREPNCNAARFGRRPHAQPRLLAFKASLRPGFARARAPSAPAAAS